MKIGDLHKVIRQFTLADPRHEEPDQEINECEFIIIVSEPYINPTFSDSNLPRKVVNVLFNGKQMWQWEGVIEICTVRVNSER